MRTEESERDNYIDVIKGIGIISIVIGHASWELNLADHVIQIGPFVYLYHLAIFFFCSGYLYKDNITNFWDFVARKLKSLYVPFVGYTMWYLIFRSIFINMGILNGIKYDGGKWITSLASMITFNGVAEFLSAFWFLPVLFFAISFYAAINYFTSYINKTNVRNILRILMFMILGLVGIYTTENGYGLLYNIQISALMVPVIAVGHYFADYKEKIGKIVNAPGCVISFIILVGVLRANIGIVELSKHMIINQYLFYPVTFCGIYFCLCLGKIFCKSKKVESGLSLVGKMSFDIMALHFLAIKLVDYVLCTIGDKHDLMNAFPRSFDNVWFIYYIAGVMIPIIMKKGYLKLKGYVVDKAKSIKWLEIKRR